MKKRFIKKTLQAVMAAAVTGMLLTGCGSDKSADAAKEQAARNEEVTEEVAEVKEEDTASEETKAEVPGAPYFVKGVYYNYAKEAENPPMSYFYVFNGDNYGYTADGANEGIGLPFDIEQADGTVKFTFGGADESEETLYITAVDNGKVYGYFEGIEDRELVFEPVEGADPDNFSAENFVNGPEKSVYRDANGWSVKYDATLWEITTKAPDVFMVYTGESAGTNMITATYTLDNAKDAIDKIGEECGDKTEYSQSIFPGTEDVTSYYAIVNPEEGGSGAYMTAFARDYMEGSLVFRVDAHMGEDEEMNMRVSDEIAAVLDSITFNEYEN